MPGEGTTGTEAAGTGAAERPTAAAFEIVHRVAGQLVRPVLLVAGRRGFCEPVFARLARVPSLPWLNGTLLLAYLGAAPVPAAEPDRDDILFCDFCGSDPEALARQRVEAYRTILRKMTQMGMIAGRGVVMR